MEWGVILGMLLSALVSAWLVFAQDWYPPHALLAVGVGGILTISVLIGLVCLLATPPERAELLEVVSKTMRRDLEDLMRWLGIR